MTLQTIVPVYFIPGTMCDQRLWHLVEALLPASIKCHHLAIPRGDNIDDIVTSIIAQLPDAPVNLVGFSLGGYLSAALACAHSQQINRLLILANTPTVLPKFEVTQRRFALMGAKTLGYMGVPTMKIKQLLASHNHQDASIIELIKTMDSDGGGAQFINQISSTTQRKDLLAPLSSLTQPIRFVYGDSDVLIDHAWLDNISAPHISMHTITQCGHMSPLESPVDVAQQINTFFNHD